MPNYLVHMTSSGIPVGVYNEDYDYYDPEYEHLRHAGRKIVLSRPPAVPWGTFIEHAASSYPSAGMRWDTYFDPSSNLSIVFRHVLRDTQKEFDPNEE